MASRPAIAKKTAAGANFPRVTLLIGEGRQKGDPVKGYEAVNAMGFRLLQCLWDKKSF
jgi:hypothetical protein